MAFVKLLPPIVCPNKLTVPVLKSSSRIILSPLPLPLPLSICSGRSCLARHDREGFHVIASGKLSRSRGITPRGSVVAVPAILDWPAAVPPAPRWRRATPPRPSSRSEERPARSRCRRCHERSPRSAIVVARGAWPAHPRRSEPALTASEPAIPWVSSGRRWTATPASSTGSSWSP